MALTSENASREHRLSLEITRVFDAPRSLVFKVWSTPEHALRWWGPRNFTAHSMKMDFRPGGAWRGCIRSPEGQDYWMGGVYREVIEPEKLIFTFAWDEATGLPGKEMLITLTFEALGPKRTRLTLRQDGLPNLAERDGHGGGWGEALDALATHLEAVARTS